MIETVPHKISIVTPSYNQHKFLEQTIQSVLCQNYPNLEYVIIDGASTDGSVDIIRKYENQLSFWSSDKDRGHGEALNKGFAHTTGEIMAWINSDDIYTPWCFDVVSEIFSSFPHIMWIVGFNSWWNSNGAMTGASRVPKNVFDYLLGRYKWIQQESVFWRRDLWERAGGHINQDYRFMVDGELWTRFFLYEPLYTVDCILGGYRSHSTNRAKNNSSECCKEMEKAISAMRNGCSSDILTTYHRLRLFQRLEHHRVQKCLIGRLVSKLFPSAFNAAAYNNITWQNEGWIERTLPFSL